MEPLSGWGSRRRRCSGPARTTLSAELFPRPCPPARRRFCPAAAVPIRPTIILRIELHNLPVVLHRHRLVRPVHPLQILGPDLDGRKLMDVIAQGRVLSRLHRADTQVRRDDGLSEELMKRPGAQRKGGESSRATGEDVCPSLQRP